MPNTVNTTNREALADVFSQLGVTVETASDGTVRIAARDVVLDSLRRVAAADEMLDGPLDELVGVLDGTGTGTATNAELVSKYDIVDDGDSLSIPASSVLGVIIGLDLAARLGALLEDRDDPGDAAEELRFLLTAAERRDIADLGEYVQAAADAVAA